MKITERDIFNYIFFRHLLTKEKINYLDSSNKYKEELDFFRSLKDELSKEISSDTKKKISQKIPVYKHYTLIELYPIKETNKNKRKNSGLVLAADSAELKPGNISQTFFDEKKEFLVKLISSKSDTKIFIFSTKEEVLKNLNVTLEPQHLKFHLEDNSKPLELNEVYDVQRIDLEFK